MPLPYLAYHGYEHWHHGLPLITSALGTLILIGPMIIRRPPKRLRPNPWFRLLAFVASYWQLLVLCLLLQGRPLAPNLVTNSIAILGLLVIIWARFSLGRNIGFVPVQRELVRRGAYANMHHPLYTGGFFTSLAFLLRADSLPNLLLIGLGVFLVHPYQEPGRRELSASRPSICRVHADREGSLGPVSDLRESGREPSVTRKARARVAMAGARTVPSTSDGSRREPRAFSLVLGLLMFSVFVNYIDRGNLSIAAPMLKDEPGLSGTQLGLLLSSFFWTYSLFLIVSGRLVARLQVGWVTVCRHRSG